MKFGLLFLPFYFLFSAASVHAEAPDIRQALGSSPAELVALDLPADELNHLYFTRGYRPAWDFNSAGKSEAAEHFINSLVEFITYHGLRAKDYPLDTVRRLMTIAGDQERAKLDVLITAALLRLAHDLHGDGRRLDDIYLGWNFNRDDVDIPALLEASIEHGEVNEFISGLVPKHAAYTRLASTLRSYCDYQRKGGWKAIDGGGALNPGDTGPRVKQLRARLAAEDYLTTPDGDTSFDEELERAVTAYQLRNGLDADGHVGRRTLAALNVSLGTRLMQIRANMERWRHMPDDFPASRSAIINIADATLVMSDNKKDLYRGPVVVGKPDRKTPFINSAVRSMIVNPFWHVPAKIARKDILPQLKKDPHYLEKLGFVIKDHQGDPYGSDIDWGAIKEQDFDFKLRQAPSDQNSLGHLKFNFDSPFAVYMHGTPHQELFAKSQRDFSSGCVRLRDPNEIGEIFLDGTTGDWNVHKIQEQVDGGLTHWVGIKNPIPLYILYWTVFPDEDGVIQFRKDVYGYDRLLGVGVVPPAH
jgi:murein L,D-transpeptidase YcbB/YkuD